MSESVTITIDDIPYRVQDGINLLQACLSLELDLPYFCWHPSLGSVGACRQCAVIQYQNKDDVRGRLVMACMTPVSEGMLVSLKDKTASIFRATNIEALMTNHPHDCPVCEEGGNCHLQDMTLLSGHIKRRYPGTKRTHLNQYLGPFLNHEMNRCIGCYRCVRFYRDYCGGTDLNVFGSKSHIYFGRATSGALDNPFSGNLAEVCPTGVFTDKPFSQHYSRKWDLQSAPAICTHCSLGCNIYPGERGGVLRRVTNRFNPQINGHFLCNRGRFGYEHVNHSERLERPLLRNNKTRTTDIIGAEQAKHRLGELVSKGLCIGIGSGRTSIENNSALLRLVGDEHFYVDAPDAELQQLALLSGCYRHSRLSPLSVQQVEQCDAALVVGEDIAHTAPRLALALRQMSRNTGIKTAAGNGVQLWQDAAVRNIAQASLSPIHIIGYRDTELSELARQNINLSPDRQLALLLQIEALLSPETKEDPAPNDSVSQSDAESNSLLEVAKEIVSDLLSADKPVLITGTQSLSPALTAACLRVALLLKQSNDQAGFYACPRQANSASLSLMRENLAEMPKGLDALISFLSRTVIDTLIVMETDLYRFADHDTLTPLLERVPNIIVIDQLLTSTARVADLVLPATSFAESQGCWLNAEGRLQLSLATMPPIAHRRAGWHWLAEQTQLYRYEDVIGWTANMIEILSPIAELTQTVLGATSQPFSVARQTPRASGRTAIDADINVKELPPEPDTVSPLSFSPEGIAAFRLHAVPGLTLPPAYVWKPKWNSDQGHNRGGEPSDATAIAGVKIYSHAISAEQESHRLIDNLLSMPVTQALSLPEGALRLAGYANIYADEELASYSASLRESSPQAHVKINAKLGARLGFKEGDILWLEGEKLNMSLSCQTDETLVEELILVPPLLANRLGAYACVSKASMEEEHE